MRQPLIVANWKMSKGLEEAKDYVRRFPGEVTGVSGIEMVVCAPFIALAVLSKMVQQTPLVLGAQNMYWEREGAFTGEISPLMLREVGVRYVIVGHSERRNLFGESDSLIAKKVASALEYGLAPILCVGEDLRQREAGQTKEVLQRQFFAALERLENEQPGRLVVAYEPVWAIGTGKAASAEDAASAAGFVRSLLKEIGSAAAQKTRVLYGGSVNADNIGDFTSCEDIDGALVGGSSLKEKEFAAIVRSVYEERRG